jgi:hypothetical protein
MSQYVHGLDRPAAPAGSANVAFVSTTKTVTTKKPLT